MLLEWRDVAPVPDRCPELKIWTSLTVNETATLRQLAKNKRVIEVGAAFGYSTVVLASVAVAVTSIDPHTTPVALGNFNFATAEDLGRYSSGTLKTLIHNLLTAKLPDVEIVCGLSQDVLPTFSGLYEFAFIDGDHGLAIAMQDLYHCARLGVTTIAVHDYREDLNPYVAPAVIEWLNHNPDWRMTDLVDTLALLEKQP